MGVVRNSKRGIEEMELLSLPVDGPPLKRYHCFPIHFDRL